MRLLAGAIQKWASHAGDDGVCRAPDGRESAAPQRMRRELFTGRGGGRLVLYRFHTLQGEAGDPAQAVARLSQGAVERGA